MTINRQPMKKISLLTLISLLLALAFLSGYLYCKGSSKGNSTIGDRKVLYYVDPMNPGHRYEKPGIAPCGMALEPVYDDGSVGRSGMGPMPPGTVTISPVKQQLIGVRVEPVEKASSVRTFRLLGKIAADETRIYRINAGVSGWISNVSPITSGSVIRKNQDLALFFSEESKNAQQKYINALGSIDRSPSTVRDQSLSPYQTSLQVFYRDTLRNLGMGVKQINELEKTRQIAQYVRITAPASGLLLLRNISANQWFEKGTELFRIADLNRVWVLLDTYENESRYFRPGEIVSFRYQGKTYHARVSSVPPQFDPSTRTLKVRLEVDNPGNTLRPDMFVDVEHSATMLSAITVPIDAVLDSGLKRTVFIHKGNGIFEPRIVETGSYFGDRVEILKGVMPGEQVVVSGNFLIDSESRFKSSSKEVTGPLSKDPLCGMLTSEENARESGLTSVYRGKTYFFCSRECKELFDKSPQSYKGEAGAGMPEAAGHPADKMHDHTKMPAHKHDDKQKKMPGHKHDDSQMKMPGEMHTDKKHGQMKMPGKDPAGMQMPKQEQMPNGKVEEVPGMPETGEGSMKMESEKKGGTMQDSLPMDGMQPHD